MMTETTPASMGDAASPTPPMSARSTMTVFLSAAVLGLAADLGTKHIVFAAVAARGDDLVVVPNLLHFTSRLNQGGPWSLGHQFGIWTNGVLAGLSVLMALGILAWAWFCVRPSERVTAAVLGLVFAGALGNLHDRVMFHAVRDFIEAFYGRYHWPTFNLADSFLVCGAGWLVWMNALEAPAPSAAAKPA